jgi:hypothetical protein
VRQFTFYFIFLESFRFFLFLQQFSLKCLPYLQFSLLYILFIIYFIIFFPNTTLSKPSSSLWLQQQVWISFLYLFISYQFIIFCPLLLYAIYLRYTSFSFCSLISWFLSNYFVYLFLITFFIYLVYLFIYFLYYIHSWFFFH